MLQMKHIGKSFSGVTVLRDVWFELYPGEVHVLAGENGAGKTTLIKILAGVHTDYEGEIWLNGAKMFFKSPHEALIAGVSAIHQEMSLVNSMTVADNIFLGREITRRWGWMDYLSQEKKARELLAQLGIEVDLKQMLSQYPVAVRQMIEVAKALIYEARIIIMDEPTSALNDLEVTRLFKIINDLKRKGWGIIYISHRMEEIYEIGDRITILRDGCYVGTYSLDELPPQNLIRLMVGRDITQQFPPREEYRREKRLIVKNFYLADPTQTKKWLVEDVSFDLQAGEILGIAGLQGSGKSELLHGLFGSYGKLTRGEVWLDGFRLAIRSPRDSIKQGLALLTNDRQGTGLIPPLNIVHNVSLASLGRFSPKGWMHTGEERAAVRDMVKALNIKIHSLEQEVQTLSGGNQQKVVLAKWIMTSPRVLLLDEPTAGIDVGAKYEIYNLMNQWTLEGKSILLITSELPELLAMADRIMVMHRGRVMSEFTREEATQESILQAAMGRR
ncbi:sugar ABC transporter ATP-binding protein [Candidatus Aminicenantes bacterium AC-334-K16]|nr:sugar ABC transporter ATP-binding protein [Candidatus Aminicenantes bacterium AC-334-K16]